MVTSSETGETASRGIIEVEYALRIVNKPIGVAEYNLTKKIPKALEKALPKVDELRDLLKQKDI